MPGNPALLNDLIQKVIDNVLTDTHSSIPGVVDSFDAVTQLAKVQPAIKHIQRDGTKINLPVLIQVPVIFPGGGGFTLTFPVEAGDEVLLIISERALDVWQQSGGVQDPLDTRKHALTDAIAITGLRSQPNKIGTFLTTGAHLRNSDGSVGILVTDAGIVISGPVTMEGEATFEDDANFEQDIDITGDSTANDHISGTISGKTHYHNLASCQPNNDTTAPVAP